MDNCCVRLLNKVKNFWLIHNLTILFFTLNLTWLSSFWHELGFKTTLANDLLWLMSVIPDHSLEWMFSTTSLHNLPVVAVLIESFYFRSLILLKDFQLYDISWLEISPMNNVSVRIAYWQDWLVRFETYFILARIPEFTVWLMQLKFDVRIPANNVILHWSKSYFLWLVP